MNGRFLRVVFHTNPKRQRTVLADASGWCTGGELTHIYVDVFFGRVRRDQMTHFLGNSLKKHLLESLRVGVHVGDLGFAFPWIFLRQGQRLTGSSSLATSTIVRVTWHRACKIV